MKMHRIISVLTLALGLALGASVANFGPASAASATPVKKVKAKSKTGIEWAVEPGNVVIYLDGKKLGKAKKLKFTKTRPGTHTVRLVKDKDETEMEIDVKKGTTLKFAFAFGDG